MKRIHSCFLFLLIIGSLSSIGQPVTEKLILTDTTDSLYLDAKNLTFDPNGDYSFVIKENEEEYFVTAAEKTGGFKYISARSGSNGTIQHTAPFSSPWFYKNGSGITVYGPAIGGIKRWMTSNTAENMAVTTEHNDSIYLFMNGRLLLKTHKSAHGAFNFSNNDWCAFSENGNTIYFLEKDSLFYLYVNDKLIDTSYSAYYQLAINNAGDYIFAEGRKPPKKVGKYNHMFFVHTPVSVSGPVRTVWDYELKANGNYYYSGDDAGSYYILVNDHLYKDLTSVHNITLHPTGQFLYTFEADNIKQINVNGRIYAHGFEEVFQPTIDEKGNFACYGLRNYYLYKYVNGRTFDSISAYGVRPVPLYINTAGQSLHYFQTDDSVYFYRDDSLLYQEALRNSDFTLLEEKDLQPYYRYTRGKSANGNSLFYVEYNREGYVVFNGGFSQPMTPAKKWQYTRDAQTGDIVLSQSNDHGFFLVQKIADNKFMVNINNIIYHELDNISKIYGHSCYFDRDSLTFYGIRDLSIYQYKIVW